MAKALIIVDVQNDFCEGGALAVAGGNDVAHRIAQMLTADVHDYDLVVATQDWHIAPEAHFAKEGETPNYSTTWPVHCMAMTHGARLHPALVDFPIYGEVFRKGRYSAAYSGFEGTRLGQGLADYLHHPIHNVTEVDVCGLATDYCVKATALDAIKAGFTTRVLVPLTAGVNPETTRAALHEMEAAGVIVAPTTTTEGAANHG